MSDLAEFLLARIAETEKVARAAMPAQGDWVTVTDGSGDEVVLGMSGTRVIAECQAKRRIVALYLGSQDGLANETDELRRLIAETISNSYVEVLKELAVLYAGHPDYREEWRP
jgi:HJR/Mrr/RecB family endonuclease